MTGSTLLPARQPGSDKPRGRLFFLCRLLLLAGLLGACACGELRPLPGAVDPQEYTPVEFQELLAKGQPGLKSGQKIRVKAYFWQFLNYDPDIIPNYLTLPRYPIRWYTLQWFSVYGSPEMRGYYDLVAMTPEQKKLYDLHRLDPIYIYGELSTLKPGLFLQVHHIEKITED